MSVVAKPGKSKRKPESATETLDQLESLSDRVGNWIAENAVWLLGGAVAILVVAGGYGFVSAHREDAREAASAALATVEADYLREMGGSLDSIAVEEPANPETARKARDKYVGLYAAVASEYPDTLEGQLAALAAGGLQQALGSHAESIATWQAALEAAPAGAAVRGLLLQRIAGVHEIEGRLVDAGAAHQSASEIASFPIRHLALAEAVRCFAAAGDASRALALFERLQTEAPELQVGPTTQARMSELQASQ